MAQAAAEMTAGAGRPFPEALSGTEFMREDLHRRYSEPHRHYHTLRHLEECFAVFDQLRAEYAWVPQSLYRKKRREILAGFLARPRLFLTRGGFERFEAAARGNLGRAIRGE